MAEQDDPELAPVPGAETPAADATTTTLVPPPVTAPVLASPGRVVATAGSGADSVPPGLRTAASWAWRLLVLAALGYVFLWLLGRMSSVVIPVAIALLLSALLNPVLRLFVAWGWNRSLATATVFIAGLAVVGGMLTLVVRQFISGAPELAERATGGVDEVKQWLINGPLGLSEDQLTSWQETAKKWFQDNQDSITTGALRTATTAGHVIAGFVLVLFTLFFFLRDGNKIWTWLVRLAVPRPARPAVHGASLRAWHVLGGYVRAAVLVAFVDAIGIGIVLFFVGVPLALPLAALVFLSSFIPIVGAFLSGLVAVLVALVAVGPVGALIVLGGVIAVQQLEGHILQPLVLGRGVNVHPLAVVLALAAGALLAGIVGALLAVPVVASLNAAINYLVDRNNDNLDDDADRVEKRVEEAERRARERRGRGAKAAADLAE